MIDNNPTTKPTDNEVDAIVQRYARRQIEVESDRYNPTKSSVYMAHQERQRALIRFINKKLQCPITDCRLLEIGCGTGGNVLEMLMLGFSAKNIVANELLVERLEVARERLPADVTLIGGDARNLSIDDGSFDIVLQSTVFSSILDDSTQEELAQKMWEMIIPGGCVIWYDFTYNNPKNPDVRGVTVNRIRELFPDGDIAITKLTLAPPIARIITRLNPEMYTLFNMIPLLRTHVLCWIKKR